jgi:hypothetical protein
MANSRLSDREQQAFRRLAHSGNQFNAQSGLDEFRPESPKVSLLIVPIESSFINGGVSCAVQRIRARIANIGL